MFRQCHKVMIASITKYPGSAKQRGLCPPAPKNVTVFWLLWHFDYLQGGCLGLVDSVALMVPRTPHRMFPVWLSNWIVEWLNIMSILTLQESILALPAHSMCSTMPPGAAAPYFNRHSEFDQTGIDTSCNIDG